MIRPKKWLYLIAVLALPLLFLLQKPSISSPVRDFFQSILFPVVQLGQASVKTVFDIPLAVGRVFKAWSDYHRIQQENVQLKSELVQYQEFAKENTRLKKVLQFRDALEQKSVAARIVAWDPSPWKKTMVIDKGKQQGVKTDMAVVVPEGLVGRVIEVSEHHARVLLLTDNDARVSAMGIDSRAQGMIAGNGSSKLKMVYLELDGGIGVEEMIVSAGVGGLFPKGLNIGRVVSLERDQDGLHLIAEVKPFVNFTKLEEVLCLVSGPAK